VQDLKGALLGKALALPANIRLGWKGLPGTNAQAYYEIFWTVKSFITLVPGDRYYYFFFVNDEEAKIS
jgi:hypothetical protein